MQDINVNSSILEKVDKETGGKYYYAEAAEDLTGTILGDRWADFAKGFRDIDCKRYDSVCLILHWGQTP